MLDKTEGIVLSGVKYGDSSLVTRIYTREFGMLSFMVKGIHSRKGAFRNVHFQPYTLCELVIYRKSNRELHSVRDIKTLASPGFETGDVKRSAVALFLAETVQGAVRNEEPDLQLFDYLKHSVHEICSRENLASHYHLQVLVDLAGYLGFRPYNNYSDVEPYFSIPEGRFQPVEDHSYAGFCFDRELSAALNQLLISPAGLPPIPLARRRELLDGILAYYRMHLAAFPAIRTSAVLQEVFT